MGLERHGHVCGLGFGVTPILVFGATKKETITTFASKLKETQLVFYFKQREK